MIENSFPSAKYVNFVSHDDLCEGKNPVPVIVPSTVSGIWPCPATRRFICHQLSVIDYRSRLKMEDYYDVDVIQIILPNVTHIEEFSFGEMETNPIVNITSPSLSSIESDAFVDMYRSYTVFMPNLLSIPQLGGLSGMGPVSCVTIHVPSSLYTSFKTATNWANYSSKILSIT